MVYVGICELGAGSDGAVLGGQDITVLIQHFETIAAGSRVLVLETVGIGAAGRGLGDGYVLVGFVDIERHSTRVVAVIAREVHPRHSRKGDHAPLDGLADGGIARTGDSERAA